MALVKYTPALRSDCTPEIRVSSALPGRTLCPSRSRYRHCRLHRHALRYGAGATRHHPDHGQIAVTGSSGGVGSVAISLLSKLGYETVAFTGRMEETDFLKSLGAAKVLNRAELGGKGKELDTERWAGAVDVAGSHTLANLLSQTKYGGAVAACGLAQGMDLPASVMPFILRNVALLGVDSVLVPMPLREQAYRRLVQDLDLHKLDSLSETVKLTDVVERAAKVLKGQIRGRTIVEVG